MKYRKYWFFPPTEEFHGLLSNIFQLSHYNQFYWWRKSKYFERATSLTTSQTLSHKVVSSTHHHSQHSTISVVTGTDYIGRWKSNIHTPRGNNAPWKNTYELFLLVKATKWWSPHTTSMTWTSGSNSLQPNNGDGINSGNAADSSAGPLPRIPYPHTYSSPLSEKTRGSVGWVCVTHLSFCFEET